MNADNGARSTDFRTRECMRQPAARHLRGRVEGAKLGWPIAIRGSICRALENGITAVEVRVGTRLVDDSELRNRVCLRIG